VGLAEDELQVDVCAVQQVTHAVVGAPGPHRTHDVGLRVVGEPQVHEAGPGDVGGVDGRVAREPRRQPPGQFTGLQAEPLADLEGEVRGVVAVLRVARTLDGHHFGHDGRVQPAVGQDVERGGPNKLSKRGGGHPRSLEGPAGATTRDIRP